MSMPAQNETDALIGDLLHEVGIVLKQDYRFRLACLGQCFSQIRFVAPEIGRSRDVQSLTGAFDRDARIVQLHDARPGKPIANRRSRLFVVIVIAEHSHRSMWRTKPGKRVRTPGSPLGAVIDKIAREGKKIRAEPVCSPNDGPNVCGGNPAAVVKVREQCDAEAFKSGRQTIDGDFASIDDNPIEFTQGDSAANETRGKGPFQYSRKKFPACHWTGPVCNFSENRRLKGPIFTVRAKAASGASVPGKSSNVRMPPTLPCPYEAIMKIS